jgi:hypothetical protein
MLLNVKMVVTLNLHVSPTVQKVNIYNLFSQAEINVNKIMFDNSVQVKMIE